MAEPTTRFRLIPQNTAEGALDSTVERLAAIAGQSLISTGDGNQANFGIIDISAGAAGSNILTLLWDVAADGGNTLVENFRLWMSENGLDQVESVCKYQPLSGADQAAPSATQNYAAEAEVGDYTWDTLPEAEPELQNVHPSDEGTSMALDAVSDDVIMWAMYLAIAAGETTGTYKGQTEGYELEFSFKYAYS